MRRQVFGVGTAQMLLTSGLFGVIAAQMGASTEAAIIIGGGLALSSTALVLQVLKERHETATQTGRLSLSILILQDLAVLPLLVLVPLFASETASLWEALGVSALRAVIALVLIFTLGRLLLRPLFRLIARLDSNELFVATTLLVVLGISFATEKAGLSLALGAFLAGLLIAETEFQHQIEADVKPYKGLLLGLFFMSVGMMIDLEFIREHTWFVLAASLALIAMKSVILYGVLRAFGYTRRSAGHTGLLLSQGGEFGFILFGLAASLGVIEDELSKLLLLVIAVTMALTPLLDMLGEWFERKWLRHRRSTLTQLSDETHDMDGHTVIAGYGALGEQLARVLEREAIGFIAIDRDPNRVTYGRRAKHPVYFGDALRADVLHALGAHRAHTMVLCFTAEAEIVSAIRVLKTQYPDLRILVRAKNDAARERLLAAGADGALSELENASRQVMSALLAQLAWPESEIERVMENMRAVKAV